jgi:hypothetical protein
LKALFEINQEFANVVMKVQTDEKSVSTNQLSLQIKQATYTIAITAQRFPPAARARVNN